MSAKPISKLDKKILNVLNKNGRKSFRTVAKEVGTSTTSIYNNVKKLEKMGVITGYIPLYDEKAIGNDFVALISLRTQQGKWKEVTREISKYPQIRAIYDITGDMDFVCVCYFRNAEELDRFIKNQLQLPFVERVLTNIVLNVYKDERRSIPPD
jgi:DNA-binding Lrp family transcriptional regulator